MNTVFLGKEEVRAYCKDIADRLQRLSTGFPKIFCPIGESGRQLLLALIDELPDDVVNSVKSVPIHYDKSSCQATFKNPQEAADVAGETVLVLDSSIHSGSSMLSAMRLVRDSGATNPIAYSLVVKKSSNFLPHYFALIVDDHDRAIFLLESIPNNRLFKGHHYPPIGFFRRIESSDATRQQQCLDTGVDSLDKISWGDLYYEHRVNGYDVIVAEDGENLAGFIKIKVKGGHTLFIDVVATDDKYRKKGIGGALMRYAENMGRVQKLKCVELWSIESQVSRYRDEYKFELLDETIDTGGGERYTLMRRRLLYHFDLAD